MEEQRQAFIDYLIENEYAESTVYSYSRGIDRISAHISDLRNSAFTIYGLTDVERLKKISVTYGTNGEFSEIGNEGHGTIRNSINRFVEFIEWQNNNVNTSKIEEVYQSEENDNREKNIREHNNNNTDNEKANEIKLLIETLNKQNKNNNSYQNLIKRVFILQIIILAFLAFIFFYKF